MRFSLFFFPRAMKGKQLKVSFGRGPPGGAVGRRQKHPHRSLSNNIPHPSPPATSTCQKPLPPSGSGRRRETFPRCLFYTACRLLIGRGASAGCQPPPLREPGRSRRGGGEKNTEEGGGGEREKSILSSHAPLGAKATSGILKDARVDRI